MDIDALRLFVDLAQTGSFSKTAERFFVSQSAVSQRIRLLEDSFGHRLLERGRGRTGAELTEAGTRLVLAASDILARIDQVKQELAALTGVVAGPLHIATVYSIGLHTLTPVLSAFLANYTEVNLRVEYLRNDQVYDAVMAGEIDAGIVACPRRRPHFEVEALADETMLLTMPPNHPLARASQVYVADIEGSNFIAFDSQIPTRALVDQLLDDQGVDVHIVQAFDNVETIKRVIEIGLGIGILPEPAVRREVRDGTLVVRPFFDAHLVRPTGILVRRGRPKSNALTAFLRLLRSYPGQKS